MASWQKQQGAVMIDDIESITSPESRISALERLTEAQGKRIQKLEEASQKIAHLMSTLGGKFLHVKAGILTDELGKFFDEVGETLKSVNKG